MDADRILPDRLFENTKKDLEKVYSVVTQGTESYTKEKALPSPMAFFGFTALLVFVAIALAEYASYKEIRDNWDVYRCNPGVTPFARFYGHNLDETMNFCIGEAVREHAPGVVDPIYASINSVMRVVDGVYDKAEKIEGGVTSLLSGFETFLMQFANAFRLIGTRIRMSLVRIRDIFARIYGAFISLAFAGISAITFGENLIYNPLVAFIDDIGCFAENTQILLADGGTRSIQDLQIGDELMGSTVTSTFVFAGEKTAMVRLHGIHVSGNHCLSTGIRADEHPKSLEAERVTRMYCISTTSHTIPVASCSGEEIVFTDYEESSDPTVILESQRAAEIALTGSIFPKSGITDFGLGLDPLFFALTDVGSWRRIDTLRIGDMLQNGEVVGIVRERCNSCCITPGGNILSAAQLIKSDTQPWTRAAHIFEPIAGSHDLCHILLATNMPFSIYGNKEFFSVRDYTEFHSETVQKPYDNFLKK